jgi:hypothetical protein
VAVGGNLLVHGFVLSFGDALVGDCCRTGMVSHDEQMRGLRLMTVADGEACEIEELKEGFGDG